MGGSPQMLQLQQQYLCRPDGQNVEKEGLFDGASRNKKTKGKRPKDTSSHASSRDGVTDLFPRSALINFFELSSRGTAIAVAVALTFTAVALCSRLRPWPSCLLRPRP